MREGGREGGRQGGRQRGRQGGRQGGREAGVERGVTKFGEIWAYGSEKHHTEIDAGYILRMDEGNKVKQTMGMELRGRPTYGPK